MKASFANPDDVSVRCFGLKEARARYGRRGAWYSKLRRWQML